MSKSTTPKRRLKAAPVRVVQPDHRIVLARRLALAADLHLQQGYTRMAEYLANQAAELREARS